MATITRLASFAATTPVGEARGQVRISYDTTRPLDVSMTFFDGSGDPAQWVFARDVLARRLPGLEGVRVDVDGIWTLVHLSSSEGKATVKLIRAQIDAFLDATARDVPYGAEVVDFDAELDQLLKDGAR